MTCSVSILWVLAVVAAAAAMTTCDVEAETGRVKTASGSGAAVDRPPP